jgi:hypothetical protein
MKKIKRSTDAKMHADDANRRVGIAIQQATLFLHDVLGGDEHMVLLTEAPDIDVWLIVLKVVQRGELDGFVFCVTDGPVNKIEEYHEFNSLDKAFAFYREVRGAGSWSLWREQERLSA